MLPDSKVPDSKVCCYMCLLLPPNIKTTATKTVLPTGTCRYLNHTGLMWENAADYGALLVFAEHRCAPCSRTDCCGLTHRLGLGPRPQRAADTCTGLHKSFSVCGRFLYKHVDKDRLAPTL